MAEMNADASQAHVVSSNNTNPIMPDNGDPIKPNAENIKLIEPKQCPVCGAKVSGGGENQVYYVCGGHLWVEKHKGLGYIIKGHCSGEQIGNEVIKPNDKQGIREKIKEKIDEYGDDAIHCNSDYYDTPSMTTTQYHLKANELLDHATQQIMDLCCQKFMNLLVNTEVDMITITRNAQQIDITDYKQELISRINKIFLGKQPR